MHNANLDNSERKLTLDAINSKVLEIHGDLVGVKDEVTNIVRYLNGGYEQYKQSHNT
jgi:UDP-2,3-diacylglucosamine pyrophosphatase LpxH